MAKKESKKAVPESKTPELTKAKKALDTYLKENNLDPTKDWTKDKKHGKKVTELVNKLNKERDKVAAKYPEGDEKNTAKLVKLKIASDKEKAEKKAKRKEGKLAKAVSKKYDYPLVDGREMNSEEKKKYRAEQRKLANKAKKEEGKKVKKEKPEKVEAAKPKKEEKKAKKAKKEED